MAIWDDIISDSDRLIYEKSGYGHVIEPGKKPALLIIDVTVAFVGDKPEPILDSIKRFPNSCGEDGWNAVNNIKDLLKITREKNVPIIYTAGHRKDEFTSLSENTQARRGMWKHPSWVYETRAKYPESNTPKGIPREIHPQTGDFVITKSAPSVFFGTSLVKTLISLGVDTLLITGCTTSGCVRASVIDAFSYNYRVLVVEECVFDRGEVSHKVNLFDMDQKYANVISLADAKEYLLHMNGTSSG